MLPGSLSIIDVKICQHLLLAYVCRASHEIPQAMIGQAAMCSPPYHLAVV